METRYDEARGVVVIGKPLEVKLLRQEYEAVQAVTTKRFGDFYREDNYGRVRIEQGHVIFLDLKSLELKVLDPSIGNLGSLRKLDVSKNQLTGLPESIGNLGSLRKLYVSGNQLTGLPESIGNLGLLEYLNVSRNQLTGLPESIRNLSLLEYLDVSRNQLDEKSRELLKQLRKRGVLVVES